MATKLPHLSDDHHFAIANVAARSAQLDHHIERTIEIAMESQPKTAEFLLRNLGSDRLVGLLNALLLDAKPDEAAPINALTKKIGGLRTERNEILHWTWIPGMKDDTAIAASSRPYREFRYKEHRAVDIQKLAREMKEVSRALRDWQSYLRQEPEKPSP